MKEEVKRWFEKSKKDWDTAEYLLKGKKYEECCLFCQQSVEKALKSVLLNQSDSIIKVHDLNLLAKKVNLPEGLRELCRELTIIYITARYPDTPELNNKSEKAKRYLSFAREILKWTEKNI